MYPFERFTQKAQAVLRRAQREAEEAGHSYIGTEHLTLGLIAEPGLASDVLAALGVTYESFRAEVTKVLGERKSFESADMQIIPTSRVKVVVETAFREAIAAGHDFIGTEHLLLAVMVEGEGVAARVLDALGATLPKVREMVRRAWSDSKPSAIGTGTSGGLTTLLMRAGQLAREEGARDIRPDHLVRAMASEETPEVLGVLEKLGLQPEKVAEALQVPQEVIELAQRERATPDLADKIKLSVEHQAAINLWLAPEDQRAEGS